MKKYTKPKIYPKVVTTKPLSAFTEAEKRDISKNTDIMDEQVLLRNWKPYKKNQIV
ncbi:MAG: hypothetical protein ACK5H1_01895 [Tenacibaculum sp.]